MASVNMVEAGRPPSHPHPSSLASTHPNVRGPRQKDYSELYPSHPVLFFHSTLMFFLTSSFDTCYFSCRKHT